MKKRFMVLLLVLVMLLGIIPTAAMAAVDNNVPQKQTIMLQTLSLDTPPAESASPLEILQSGSLADLKSNEGNSISGANDSLIFVDSGKVETVSNGWIEVTDPIDDKGLMQQINTILVNDYGQTEGTYDYSVVKKLKISGAFSKNNYLGFSSVYSCIGGYLEELDVSKMSSMVSINQNYTKLKKVTISENIGMGMYLYNVPELETIIVPEGFAQNSVIGGSSNVLPFCTGSSKLKEMVFLCDKAPVLSGYVFKNGQSVTACVPKLANGYESDNFQKYFLGGIVVQQSAKEIQIANNPDKTIYYAGEKLDLTGLKVEAVYEDNSREEITYFTVEPSTNTELTVDDTTVTVTYQEKTVTFPIQVKAIDELKAVGDYKTKYYAGEKLDLTGLNVMCISGEEQKSITKYAVDPEIGTVLTQNTKVKISYLGAETSFDLEVMPITGLEITKMPDKTTYMEDQALDFSGMEVSAEYGDELRVVTDYTTEPAAGTLLKEGEQMVTVSYLGKIREFAVNVTLRPGVPEGDWVKVYDPKDASDLIDQINSVLREYGQEEGHYDYSSVKKLSLTGVAANTALFNYTVSREALAPNLEELDYSGLSAVLFIPSLPGVENQTYTKLKKVTLPPKNLTSGVFSDLPELETIVFPEKEGDPYTITGAWNAPCHGCPNVKEVYFEDDIAPIFKGTPTFGEDKPVAYVSTLDNGYSDEAFTQYFSDVIVYEKSEGKTLEELNALIEETDVQIKKYENPFSKLTDKWSAFTAAQNSAKETASDSEATEDDITKAWNNLNSAKKVMPFISYAYIGITKDAEITAGTKDEEVSAADEAYDWYYADGFSTAEISKRGYEKYYFRATKPVGSVTRIDLTADEEIKEHGPSVFALTANMYTNLDDSGTVNLGLEENKEFILECMRVTQTVSSEVDSVAIEPEFYFDLYGDSVKIEKTSSNNLKITALQKGTSVIKVTYGAFENSSKGFTYSALPAENAGVVVVNVDGGAYFKTGINVINDHDTFYFDKNDGYRNFTFTPPEGSKVRVHDPLHMKAWGNGWRTYTENAEGNVTVHLRNGRNIIEVTDAEGNVQYQVIRAKAIDVTRNGNTVSMKGIEAPVEKIATVYNPGYEDDQKTYLKYSGDGNAANSNRAGQYKEVATDFTVQISDDGIWTGKIWTGWYGAALRSHRTHTGWGGGEAPKNTGEFGSLPEFGVTLAPEVPLDKPENPGPVNLTKIKFTAMPDKTTYVAGEKLDLTGLEVTGSFSDGTISVITDYTTIPENGSLLTEDTTQVSVTVQGTTKTFPITVLPEADAIRNIEITEQPDKAHYYAGDKFDSTGMVVTANYTDGSSRMVTAYTVTPEVLKEGTTEVIITYGGKTATVSVDVEKLLVTELEVTNNPDKTNYKAGEVFNPAGMVISAVYNSGKKEKTVEYTYTPNKVLETGDKEMTIMYTGDNAANNGIFVIVPITVSAAEETSDEIIVKFTLYGDSKHGETEPKHTLKDHNLEIWLPETEVIVPKDSMVVDVFTKAAGIAGIPYDIIGGNYISSVRGLCERDNGPSSGWMYTLNGSYPDLGVAEQKVNDGDSVVLHYTDDFTMENADFGGTVADIIAMIDALPDVDKLTLADAEAVNEVRDAFEALSDEDKAHISESKQKKLDDAVLMIVQLTKVQTDEAAAKEVSDLIAVIGDVTVDSKDAIDAARVAYDKLSNAQKELVSNYDVLTAAEKAYADLTTKPEVKLPFEDLNAGAWYMDSIHYVYANDIMNGITVITFEPNSTLTRGMYVTMLYRLEGEPEVNGKVAYSDVEENAWFAKAVIWGTENGIIEGYDGKFNPDGSITREQMAAMMYRYAEYKGSDVSATASFDQFVDGETVSDWSKEEMGWAVASGLLKGLDTGKLEPQGNATRAQAATVFQRFMETIVK